MAVLVMSLCAYYVSFQVDLGEVHYVVGVKIEMRQDCCTSRMHHYEARVGMEDVSSQPIGLLDMNQVSA